MRPGIRTRAPARSDMATQITTQLSPWGQGHIKGWLSPYLEMGPASNQNYFGNLHAQTGSNTNTTGTGSMAFSVLGDIFTGRRVVINGTVSGSALTVNSITSGSSGDIAVGMAVLYDAWQANGATDVRHIASGTYPNFTLSGSPGNATAVTITLVDRYLGIDGQPAFSRIPDPDGVPGKYCWQFRLTHEDYRPSGQDDTNTGLQKVLARFSDSGTEPSNGLGLRQPVGTYYMDMFAIRIPAASLAILKYQDGRLIWQHKNSAGDPGLSLDIVAGQARAGPSTLPTGERMPLAPANEPRIALGSYGWDQTDNGGLGEAGVQLQVNVVDNIPADTWMYFLVRAKPRYLDSDNPHTQMWVAVGNGAAVKKVDSTKANNDNSATDVFRQFGMYIYSRETYINQTTGANEYGNTYEWFNAGEELKLLSKEYAISPQWRADSEPPLWLVDQWFNELRGR